MLPVVQRELLVAARKRTTYGVRSGAALVAFLVTFLMLNMGAVIATTKGGAQLFHVLTTMAFWACFFGGALLTADCLSVERRNDTLGLLFLTDLKGYDVVFGKLAAKSLAGVACLIAIVPMLSIPLLLGGVTAAEFWRVIAVLVNTLLLSLSIGMVVSVFSRDPRNVFAFAICLMAVVAWGIPLLAQWFGTASALTMWLWKLYPYAGMVAASPANFSTAHENYFVNVGALFGFSVLMLMLASSRVANSWGTRPPNALTTKLRAITRRVTHGTRAQQADLRARLLDVNPVLWLQSRQRSLRAAMSILFAVLAACAFALNFHRVFHWSFITSPIVCFLFLYLLFVALVAFESACYIIERRKDGAIELMLSTSLTTTEILHGHYLAARRLFSGAALVMIVYAALWLWMAVKNSRDDNHWLAAVFPVLMLVNLFVSARALMWCTMSYSLRSRVPSVPALRGFAMIVVLPLAWSSLLCFPALIIGKSDVVAWTTIVGVCVVNSSVLTRLAKERLENNFRAALTEPARVRATEPT